MIRTFARTLIAWPAIALLTLSLAAAPLRADGLDPGSDSWARLFRYSGCALGIAAATTGIGVAAAVAMCLYILATD